MKITIILAATVLIGAGCQKLLLPPVSNNTPTTNFESMWKGYDAYYGMFEVRHINWDSVGAFYRSQVNDSMNNEQLYDVLCQLITPLNDIHAFLQPTSDHLPRYESSVFFRTHTVQQDFSTDVIQQHYLPFTTIDEKLQYGIFSSNIGYLHFGAFDKPLSFYQQKMPAIMDALKNTRAMIVDIRNHEGGDDIVSRYIAGLFAQERKLFMTVRKRNGAHHSDFTTAQQWYVEKQDDAPYTKPVIVLTTRWTASAGETFTWAMKTQTHVQQMGDTTAGGFTDVISRELPNGWLYFVGVGDYRNANGESEEGKGIVPDEYIINKPEDINAGKDKVLEAALHKLQ